MKILATRLMFTVLATAVFAFPIQSSVAKPLAIVEGTVFTAPKDMPIEKGVVVLDDGKIVSVGSVDTVEIPSNAEIIDASGLYITAGFWNSHVHYTGPLEAAASRDAAQLNEILSNTFLRWGIVNTVDTGSWLENTLRIRGRIEKGEVDGPRILTAAGGFVPIGGSPYYIEPIELPEFKNPENARERVQSTLRAGADAIKLFTGSWATPETVIVMEPDDVRAATDAAHEKGALVFAHPSDSDGARVAIENGVDILAHVFTSEIKGPWDKSLPAEMAARNMALVPTLKLWRPELTKEGLPSHIVTRVENTAIVQTKAIHEAGVTILFGTDVGYMQDPDTTEEFRLMGQAGMDYKAILASLTTAPAARYRVAETIGRIQVDYEADMVLLGSDPRADITAYADVVATIRGGRVVFQR